jgi:hypothetical protein
MFQIFPPPSRTTNADVRATSSITKPEVSMNLETQNVEYPYTLKIETSTGQSVTVPIAFLTREQVAKFLQSDFQRITKEAGVKGIRVYVEQAATADYDKVLQDVTACLRRASLKAV